MCCKCENFELLLTMEQERIRWLEEVTVQNINLHKKINEQQELVIILKNKLLEKRSNFISEFVGNAVHDISKLTENEYFRSNYHLEKQIKDKLEEITKFLTVFNNEREIFQKEIEDMESFFSESITYLNGLVDYFRDSLVDELNRSNRLKQYFTQEISMLTASNHYVVLNILKEERQKLNNELKLRYQKTIQKSKEEIERQNLLVSKLRKHNRQLYLQIHKTKVENEEKIAVLQENIQDLKAVVKKLKEKNDYLHVQLKLEVKGCQNDIYDARKRIREFKKLQS